MINKIKISFNFEKEIIDPLLQIIKDNQEYLTKMENLSQLAKLGYMFNTLWNVGRVSWDRDSKLWDKYEYIGDYNSLDICQNNPKYKLEDCDPINENIDNLIYDAWGMHVKTDIELISFDEFHSIMKSEYLKEYTNLEILQSKINKTMDDWFKILMDSNYRYVSLFPSRKSVVNHLMFVIGNGYKLSKDGYIFETASGANQNISLYSGWEEVKLEKNIQEKINLLINNPFVKESIDYYYKILEKIIDKEKIRKEKIDKLYDEWQVLEKNQYDEYYPVCNYSIIDLIYNGSKCDTSYIKYGIEACKNILLNGDKENENNIRFATDFLIKFDNEKS